MDKSHKTGLYGKYQIKKADGSPVDPDANYFILRIDNDPDAFSRVIYSEKNLASSSLATAITVIPSMTTSLFTGPHH